MALLSLLRHRVDWQRPSVSIDASRGGVREWTAVAGGTGLRCLVQPATSKELLAYRQRNVKTTHKIYFDRLLPLLPGDRLLQLGSSPARYFVITGWADQGGQSRVFCVEAYEQILG